MFEDRKDYLLSTVARRLQQRTKEISAFDVVNAVQDGVLRAATAHIDRIILEAFIAGIDVCEGEEACKVLHMVCAICTYCR